MSQPHATQPHANQPHVVSDARAAAAPTLEELASSCATPCYVFDEGVLARRIARLRAVLPASTDVCYAMKANPFVLAAASRHADAIEVCSPGELDICRSLHVGDHLLVISGVYKEERVVKSVLASDDPVRGVTIESRAQFELVSRAAASVEKSVPLLLRLTSGSQFGMDLETLVSVARDAARSPHVTLRGVQFFAGTQKSSARRFVRELSRLDDLLERLSPLVGGRPLELEYGPGLPIEYCDANDVSQERPELLSALSEAISGLRHASHVTLEIGRYLAAPCGTYLTGVVDTKATGESRYAIVDGGKHQVAYYGPSLALKSPAFRVVGEPEPVEREPWSVCGSLCTTGDILVKRAMLAPLSVGDVLAFPNAGAYCMTEGISLFLSRDLPSVYLVGEDGTLSQARPRIETMSLNTPLTP